MAKTTSINLLRANQTHYVDTILKWALGTGRFLIILTESIALMAFAYRFTLDRQLVDLADKIKNNSAYVSLYIDEPRYRNIQERLDYSEKLAQIPGDPSDLLKEFVSIARGKVIFESLLITDKTVTMKLTTNSTTSLSTFMNGLKTTKLVKSVSVDKVENRPSSGMITADITAQLLTTKEVKKDDI